MNLTFCPCALGYGLVRPSSTVLTDWCLSNTMLKQAFADAGIPFDYVNCEKSPDRCQGIDGYPVVKNFPNPEDNWDGFKALPKG